MMRTKYNIKTIFLMIISIVFVVMELSTSDALITWVGVFFGFCFVVFLLEPLIKKHEVIEIPKEFVEFNKKNIRRVIPN